MIENKLNNKIITFTYRGRTIIKISRITSSTCRSLHIRVCATKTVCRRTTTSSTLTITSYIIKYKKTVKHLINLLIQLPEHIDPFK